MNNNDMLFSRIKLNDIINITAKVKIIDTMQKLLQESNGTKYIYPNDIEIVVRYKGINVYLSVIDIK